MTAHIWPQQDAVATIALGGSGGIDPGALAAASLVQLLVGIGVYVWLALALTAVFRKVGVAPWKAWVPVLNGWELFVLGGMRGWWAAVLTGGAILVAIVGTIVGGLFAGAAVTAGFGGDAASAAGALAAAAVVPALIWLAFLVFAVVVQVRLLRALCRGFGVGTAYVVLGVILFPVWASVIGWGSARWLGRPTEQASGPFGEGPTPGASTAAPVDTATRASSASSASSSSSASSGAFAPPTAFAAVPAAPADLAAADQPADPGPVTASPWAPPPPPAETVAEPVAPLPWTAPPASPAPASPAPAPAAPAPAPVAARSAPAGLEEDAQDVDERTVLAARRAPQASLRLPAGTSVVLTSDTAVLGRNPVATADAPDAQLIPVDDTTRTVSKTHALLRRTSEGWMISDLASTNGVFVGEDEAEVSGPTRVTGAFHLGDAELHLSEDG
ncbi:FHA domain-containing protein [Microbacterium oleivorans]|uniref:FHA domain-containing protein n=1 Tax=Microbacterium oleivorans TaxID=273677 RepID=A0A7D5JCB4_9MICO|nr:FHA domain-containing protein [Microbacterium oleivorans]QLD10700.1 FHA domain-containing protein [Microbacterium oleivorans]